MKKTNLWIFKIIFFIVFPTLLSAELRITNFLTLKGDIAFTLVPDKNKAYDLNKDNFYNPYSPAHIFLFSNLKLRDNLFVIGDYLIQTDEFPRVIGLYLIYSPFYRPEFNIKIGMNPTFFGTFSPRAYPHTNFLIGYPLMRQYQTGISYEELSKDVMDLIQNKEERHGKISPIDEIYWDSSIQFFGEYKFFEYSIGITQGALSWPQPLKDKTPGKQIIGRVGLKPIISLNLGISFAKGNYFEHSEEYSQLQNSIMDGIKPEDFKQKVLGLDYYFSKEYLIIQGEILFTKWKSPPIKEALSSSSFYVEIRYKILPYLFIAGRYDELNFNKITSETSEKVRWDSEVRRAELGLTYSLSKDLILKINYQDWVILSSPRERHNQLGAQLNYHF